jgi:plasmanylethanolamine desaturase
MTANHLLLMYGKITLEFVAAVFAADFAAGFIHWLEDAYGREDIPVIGKWIVEANVLHHREPRAFAQKNWWQSNWDLTIAASLIVLAAWHFGFLHWPLLVFAVLSANANEIHKWEHRSPRENGKIITFLQHARLLQTVRHHAKHHTNPKDSNYCTITNFLNPVLDGVRFWEGLEWIVLHATGLRRRVDPTVPKPRTMPAISIIPTNATAPIRKCSGHCGRQRLCGNVACPAFALRRQAGNRPLAQAAGSERG